MVEHRGATRYRMLETVREFAALRLTELGEAEAAREALTAWAVGVAERVGPRMFGSDQVAAVDELDAEEANLADVLRRLLVGKDASRAVRLLAALGGLWAVTGNFPRFLAMADLAEQVLLGWVPPPELEQVTVEAVALVLVHLGFMRPDGVDELAGIMRELPIPKQAWSRVARAIFVESSGPTDRRAAVLRLTEDPDRRTVAMAWLWAAILAENEGAIEESGGYIARALAMVDEDTTVWEIASLNSQASTQALNTGDHARAERHARTAIPLLERLHADEDAASMRAGLALSALRRGHLDEAERLLDEIGEVAPSDVTAELISSQVRAEVVLLRGDVDGGLAAFDRCLAMARTWTFGELSTSGLEPWTLIAVATDLAAHVRFAETPARRSRGEELEDEMKELLSGFPAVADAAVDYPVTGMALAALGLSLLGRDPGPDAEAAVRLLALGQSFGYNRWFPAMAWEPMVELADDAAPGLLAAVLEEYGDRKGRELRADRAGAGGRDGVGLHLPGEAADRERREDRDHDGAAQERPPGVGGHRDRCWPGRGSPR